MLEDSHDHAKLMGRPNKKVTTGVTKIDAPTVEDQSLKKDAPQDPSSSKASEAEEQRLRELLIIGLCFFGLLFHDELFADVTRDEVVVFECYPPCLHVG